MIAAVVALLAAANLTSPFGPASATAEVEGAYIAVTVEVTIDPGYQPDYVVVHLLNPDGQETFTLGPTAEGTYAGKFTVLPFNRALIFEVGREGDFVQSTTVSLIDLGIDPDLLQTTYRPPDSGGDESRWAWLALGAGALAVATLLALVLLPGPAKRKNSAALVDTTGDETVVIDE